MNLQLQIIILSLSVSTSSGGKWPRRWVRGDGREGEGERHNCRSAARKAWNQTRIANLQNETATRILPSNPNS